MFLTLTGMEGGFSSEGGYCFALNGVGIRMNRALCDTTLKFCTMIEYDLINVFSNKAIADSLHEQNGHQRFLSPTYLGL